MDSEQIEIWRDELDQININLEAIKNQYEHKEEPIYEETSTYQKHLDRIRNLSSHQKILIDPEILAQI